MTATRTYDPRSVTITVDGCDLPLPPDITRETLDRLKEALTRASGIPAAMLGADWNRMFEQRVSDGARGCFHDGCDPSMFAEGGSRWCRWAK